MFWDIVGPILGLIIGSCIAFPTAILYRKRVSEKLINSAEEEAKRIINEAIKSAESKQREMILEAKEELRRTEASMKKRSNVVTNCKNWNAVSSKKKRYLIRRLTRWSARKRVCQKRSHLLNCRSRRSRS